MLKLFEEHNEYYTKIEASVFNINCIAFTSSEIKHIENYMKDIFGTESWVLEYGNILMVGYRRPVSPGSFVFESNDLVTEIYSLGDEWYAVYLKDKDDLFDELYKCDQLEGLFELLTNKL